MILAVTFAYAGEFFCVQAVAVAFSYGLCFEFVVVDFLDLEHFTPVSFSYHLNQRVTYCVT